MKFCKQTEEGEHIHGITDPCQRERGADFRDHILYPVSLVFLHALVEVMDGFSEPQVKGQERRETCGSLCEPKICQGRCSEDIPITRFSTPTIRATCWITGPLNMAGHLRQHCDLSRTVITAKRMEKRSDSPRAIAMEMGVPNAGALNQRASSWSRESTSSGEWNQDRCVRVVGWRS